VRLSIAERDGLRELVPDLAIVPMVGTEHVYELTAGSRIGNVRVGDLSVRIRPKIPIDRVLFLLSYSLDPVRWMENPFNFQIDESLVEAVIPGFVSHLRRAFRPGLLQGYRTEEDAIATVRGRVRFDDQVKRRYGIAPPIEVRFDEFTEDITENRLLKAAIARLGMMRIRSATARRSLRQFDALLETVAEVEFGRALPQVTYTRLNERYRPALELAALILRSTSFQTSHGRVRGIAFLVDMNRAFEDFVVIALREALGLTEREFPQGARRRRLSLDVMNQVLLEPDISWWEEDRCVFVGDIKYKRVNALGIKHPDLYQLLSYAVATDLPGGLLIYAAGEGEPVTHEVIHLGKALEVTTLTLAGDERAILSQVEAVADRIRHLRLMVLGRSAA
jgi:5-methylcytosine-specific restriction enzyme subunit McrC